MIINIWLRVVIIATVLLLYLYNAIPKSFTFERQRNIYPTTPPSFSAPFEESEYILQNSVELSYQRLLSATNPQLLSTTITAITNNDIIVKWEASSQYGIINNFGKTFSGSITESFSYTINPDYDTDVISIVFYGYNAGVQYTTEISVSKNEDATYSLAPLLK